MPAGESYDGRVRFIWLATNPADLDHPTIAEINAGTDLSGYLVPESFDPKTGNSRVETRDALTSFDSQAMGRHQAAPEAMFKTKLRTGGTAAFDLFDTRLTTGCIAFFEDATEGAALAAGNTCDLYPSCETGSPLRQPTAINQERRFKVEFAVGDAPHLNVTVAA